VLSLQCPAHVQHPGVEVDVSPGQPGQLAGPQPHRDADDHERFQPVTLHRAEKRDRLIG
jgi:hypothetical protein